MEPRLASVDKLEQLYRDLPEPVKLVYDQNDAYQRIITALQDTVGNPDGILASLIAHEKLGEKLEEVSDHIAGLPLTVSGWTGSASQSFADATDATANTLVQLSELTGEARQVLNTAMRALAAGEKLILGLVTTSLNYSVSSLNRARVAAPETMGFSMSTWVSNNLAQVNKLLRLVEENMARVQDLISKLTKLLVKITDVTQATARNLTKD